MTKHNKCLSSDKRYYCIYKIWSLNNVNFVFKYCSCSSFIHQKLIQNSELIWLHNNFFFFFSPCWICSALLLSVLSSKVQLKLTDQLHRPVRLQSRISLFLFSHSKSLFCMQSCTKSRLRVLPSFSTQSDVLSSTAKAWIALSFYFPYPDLFKYSTVATCRPCSTWIRPRNLSGWQEMWTEFPHQTAGWGVVFVYCEGSSEDVGAGEEGRASFTPECRSSFLREECGHKSSVALCAHLGCEVQTEAFRGGQFVYCVHVCVLYGEVRRNILWSELHSCRPGQAAEKLQQKPTWHACSCIEPQWKDFKINK